MLLCLSRRRNWGVARGQGGEDPVDFTGNVSLQTTDDLLLGLALGGTLGNVGSGTLVAAHAAEGDHVQRPVGVAVAMTVQTVADTLLARRGRDGRRPAQVREGGLVSEALGIISGGDQQGGSRVGANQIGR